MEKKGKEKDEEFFKISVFSTTSLFFQYLNFWAT